MPIVTFKIPDPITVRDPESGIEVGSVSLLEFVQKAILRSNPKWGFGYAAVRSAMAIEQAIGNPKDGVVSLSEEDWRGLVGAIEAPKRIDRGGTTSDGFGCWLHPIIPQFMPFLEAIMKAV